MLAGLCSVEQSNGLRCGLYILNVFKLEIVGETVEKPSDWSPFTYHFKWEESRIAKNSVFDSLGRNL